jgi:hypothetical protein
MALHDALLALSRGSYGDSTVDVTVASVVVGLLIAATGWTFFRSGRHSGQH